MEIKRKILTISSLIMYSFDNCKFAEVYKRFFQHEEPSIFFKFFQKTEHHIREVFLENRL